MNTVDLFVSVPLARLFLPLLYAQRLAQGLTHGKCSKMLEGKREHGEGKKGRKEGNDFFNNSKLKRGYS
jgi:hypothetical protein